MNKFWVVWCETHGVPTYKHNSEQKAKSEAVRMAQLHPGCVFHVLVLVDSCRKNEVVWASQNSDDIPF